MGRGVGDLRECRHERYQEVAELTKGMELSMKLAQCQTEAAIGTDEEFGPVGAMAENFLEATEKKDRAIAEMSLDGS